MQCSCCKSGPALAVNTCMCALSALKSSFLATGSKVTAQIRVEASITCIFYGLVE